MQNFLRQVGGVQTQKKSYIGLPINLHLKGGLKWGLFSSLLMQNFPRHAVVQPQYHYIYLYI